MEIHANLTTERLSLRPLRADDAEAIVAGVADWEVARWLAVVPFPYGRTDAEAFLASPGARRGRAWAVCDAGGLKGVVSLTGELGYWLARRVWGRGYMTEAAGGVIDAAFSDPARTRIEASHMIGNSASARVLGKLGMRGTGDGELHFRAMNGTLPVRRMELTRTGWHRLRDRARSSIAGPKETAQ